MNDEQDQRLRAIEAAAKSSASLARFSLLLTVGFISYTVWRAMQAPPVDVVLVAASPPREG